MVTFKGGYGKLYYTLHTRHSLKQCRTISFFFFFEKQTHIHTHTHTHTQGKGKEVLTQRHTITPLKSYDNF